MKEAKEYLMGQVRDTDFEKDFIFDDISKKKYSYAQFFSLALELSEGLEKAGKGKTVVAVLENSFELALLYFSVMLTDGSVTVIDPQKGKEEIAAILEEIEDPYLIDGQEDFLQKFQLHGMAAEQLSGTVSNGKSIKEDVLKKIEKRDFTVLFLVTYTSGTSGKAKGVMNSLGSLISTSLALHRKVGTRKDSRLLHVMPMTYMAGILNSLFYPFVAGASVVITKRFSIMSARRFWNTVSEYGADLFWVSPAMLTMIDQMDRGDMGETYCLSHDVTFLVGTAPLTSEGRKRFNERYHTSVFASYGLSETLFISVETEHSLKISEIDSVGELLEGVAYRITEEGEFQIKVPWMYLGYTNEDTDSYFEDGYYKSGDLVELRNGCLYVTGRSKDLIIKGGMNVSPALIEKIVRKDGRISETAVIGVHDGGGEEKICCAYVCRETDGNKELETEIRKNVMQELGKNYAIDYMWSLRELPRNINGKLEKKKMREMWEAGHGGK